MEATQQQQQQGLPQGPTGARAAAKRPSLLDRFKEIARGPVKPGKAAAPDGEQHQAAAAGGAATTRSGRPPLPLVPGRAVSQESLGSNGSGGGGKSRRPSAYTALANLAIRHQMNLLSRSRRRQQQHPTQPAQLPNPTVTLQPPGSTGVSPSHAAAVARAASGGGTGGGAPPPVGHVRASSSLLRWGDYDTGSEDEGEEDGEGDGSTVSDNMVWDESSDEEGGGGGEGEEKPPVDPAYDVTPKLSARTLALNVTAAHGTATATALAGGTPSRLAERRKGLHISVDDEEEEAAAAASERGEAGSVCSAGHEDSAGAAGGHGGLDGSTNTSSSVATTAPASTPYYGGGGPPPPPPLCACSGEEGADRKRDGGGGVLSPSASAASSSCALGLSGSGSLSGGGGGGVSLSQRGGGGGRISGEEERVRRQQHHPSCAASIGSASSASKGSPQWGARSLDTVVGGGSGGDFVFQPSPALQAARAVRGPPAGAHHLNPAARPRTPTDASGGSGGSGSSGGVGGWANVAAGEGGGDGDDGLVGRLSDEAEAEGRVVYSSAGGSFALGGFTIGQGGLERSPRNRRRRRPSLNAGDNFVVLARLGSGNSSAVHKALHVPTMRLVALKALPLYDAERRAQVMRELRILYSNLASIEGGRGKPCIEPTIEEAEEEEGAEAGGEGDETGALAEALAAQASLDDDAAAVASPSHEGEGEGESKEAAVRAGDGEGAEAGAEAEAEEEAEAEQHCPYIVSFYDAFADAKHGCLTLVVEYMNGGSLQDLVNRGGCANEDVLAHISYNVLQGLAYLHARKKIHRDIKPSNLLINSCGFVKIADFGVSRSLDQPGRADGDLMADTFIGTVGYMSPERITGQGYSFGADIWAFGLSILACALGAFPLEESTHEPEKGGGYWGLVHAVCESPAPALPETFTPAFRSFVGRCLVKDPAQRASSQELLVHPFIASRHHLHKDARGRIAEFPKSLLLDMQLGELGMICRVLALHLLTRERQQLQQQQRQPPAYTTPAATTSPQWAQQPPSQQQPQPLPDRPTLVRRLAAELGLRSEVVGERLEDAFAAIRKQEEEAAAAAAAADDWDSRGGGGGPGVPSQVQAQPAAGVVAAIPDMEGRGGGGARR